MFVKLESIYDYSFGINTDRICKISKGQKKYASDCLYNGPFCILAIQTGEFEYVKGTLDEVIDKLKWK